MNKENKKIAAERRAQEREKQQKKKRRKEILANWGPIVLIVVVVIVLVIAIVTSGGSNDSEAEYDSELGFALVDEDGNQLEIMDWTEVDEDYVDEEEYIELDTTEGIIVADGDMVNIDYAGYLDGVAFEGGTSEDEDVTVGAGEYIPGFEEGLIGHAVGESFDMPVTFPEGYSEELGGKDVIFKVTINGIYQ